MPPTFTQLGLLALVWLAYFIIHSVLASLGLKTRVASHFPRWLPAYRIVFNGLAILLLLIPLELLRSYQGAPLWQWQGYELLLANGLRIATIIGFLWTLKFYDGSELLGFRQLREKQPSIEDQENFHISPFHRYVRHPWYFFAMIYIWAGSMDATWLVSAIMISLYFIVGSRLEERKLLRYHGEVYARYARVVPGLFPLPWRFLSPEAADELLKNNALEKAAQR
jgi:protein-S-isoprenylcysteine O-methyltransferase Ste14